MSRLGTYAGAAIIGVGESDVGVFPERTTFDLQHEAIERALTMAGIELPAIDGVFVSKSAELVPGDLPASVLADRLGLVPRHLDTTLTGGSAPVMQVARAAAAITAGMCSTALVAYGSTQASRRRRRSSGWAGADPSDIDAFERSTGYRHPISTHALIARRHMHEYGTTSEQLAAVAVSGREWARLNPTALRREPLTVADVLASRTVSSPLHVLDCCLVTDGAGAIVLAADPRKGSVVLGYAERHSHLSLAHVPDLTTSVAVDTGARALGMAGVTPSDVDVVQLYDAFTDMPLILLEDLGFCAKGEGGPFVESGASRPGGSLPMNTQGGGLSHCHPGMYGVFLVIEAHRQLAAEAGERQVPGASIAVVHGVGGGTFGSHATLVLGAA